MFSRQPETWVPCTGAILGSLEPPADTGTVYMLKVTPDAPYPLTPVQEAPKAEITWWRLRQPLIVTDGL